MIRTLSIFVLFAAGLLLVTQPVLAENVCVRNNAKVVDGKVKLSKGLKIQNSDCSDAFKEIGKVNNETIAFAAIDENGNVLNFGGTQATQATASRISAGVYVVEFRGDFSTLSDADPTANIALMTWQSSARGNNLISAVVNVADADSGRLTMNARTFDNSGAVDGDGLNVTIMLGKAP